MLTKMSKEQQEEIFEKQKEIAKGYTRLMIQCARDEQLRKKILDHENNQDFIRERLTTSYEKGGAGMVFPEKSYVIVDDLAETWKVFIGSNKENKLEVITDFDHHYELFKTFPHPPNIERVEKVEGDDLRVDFEGILEHSDIIIRIPLLIVSNIVVKFEDDAEAEPEIILSSC